MGFRIERKPFKIGQSYAVTLPLGWIDYYGKRVTKVTIIGNTLLIIAPEGLEEQAAKLVEGMEQGTYPAKD